MAICRKCGMGAQWCDCDIRKQQPLKEASISRACSIADRIVADLFVNAYGDVAQRLVLEGDNGDDFGGRNRDSVRAVILKHLSN